MAVQLRLWGVPELVDGDRPPTRFVAERRFQLLAWLALQAGQSCTRDQAAALLWPAHDAASARRNLRKVILDARALPGSDAIEADEHTLRWRIATDLGAFDAALATQPPRLADALALRRGVPLAQMDLPAQGAWTDWLHAERARWESRWQRAAHQHLLTLQEPAARDAWAQRLLEVDALDDVAMAARLQACLALGAVAAAHQAWRAYAEKLAQELGIEPPAHLRVLIERSAPAAGAPAAAQPPPAGGFIGRKIELAALCEGFDNNPEGRLVTLLGPGGVGKSRLAAAALPRLPQPALAVEMQDLDSSAALAARLAQRLGLTLDDRRATAPQIARALAGTRLLLLDNAEQIADLPAWLQALRDAAPTLALLVTSRARLVLPGEQVFTLDGLALPDEASHDIDAAPAFDAVRLFATRAAAALPAFDLARHLPAAIEIVQRCGGWPLAIELAAAWVRLLPPEQIARELRESIDLLERDPADVRTPARPEHTSLRAVFDRSLGLLAPRERAALEALAVFRGAVSRTAAQAVAEVALPLLASLVDKSLLSVSEAGRFVLHSLVAEAARERLAAEPARLAALQDRHALHHLRQLADAAADTTAAPQEVDRLMSAAEPDLLQALEHAFACALSGDLVAQTLPIWTSFFRRAGRVREGAHRLRPGMQWPPRDPLHLRIQARARAAVAMLWADAQEPMGEIDALASAGLQQAREAGDALPQVQCLQVLADCESHAGRFERAQALLEQAMTLAEAAGLQSALLGCLRTLGSAACRRGHYDDALTLLRRARSLAREAGYRVSEADALLAQADPLLLSGRYGEAETTLRECRQLMAALRMRLHHCYVVMMHGVALAELGRLGAAREALADARREAESIGQERYLATIDSYQAWVDALDGRLDAAAAALRRVARQAHASAWVVESMRALLYHGEVLRRRGQYAEAAAAWQAVADDSRLPAGERDTARRWLAALALGPHDAARVAALSGGAEQALAALLGTP
jgi:predicted ATPase/DNA-binding SARP family transcriptional activator